MQQRDGLEEVKQCLAMWGEWLRDGAGFRLGYPTSVAFAIKSGKPTPLYSDDVAERIEMCMCQLKQRHASLYWALYYYYYWELSQDQCAVRLKIGRTKFTEDKKQGEVWLDGIYFSEKYKKSA